MTDKDSVRMYLENRIQEINDKINILIKTSEVIVINRVTSG